MWLTQLLAKVAAVLWPGHRSAERQLDRYQWDRQQQRAWLEWQALQAMDAAETAFWDRLEALPGLDAATRETIRHTRQWAAGQRPRSAPSPRRLPPPVIDFW